MKTVVITGANRGIGLGLTKAFLRQGWQTYAACRNPDGARDLWELENDYRDQLTLIQMNVTDLEEIAAAAKSINQPVDLLINNAGILPNGRHKFLDMDFSDMELAFRVNTLGPMQVTRALMPQLQRAVHPRVINVSSKVGSIDDNSGGGMYAYRTSKTALNMVNKCLSIEFPKITFAVVHPGWVQTDMGGSHAPTEIAESCEGLISVILGLKSENTGCFVDFRGQSIPW